MKKSREKIFPTQCINNARGNRQKKQALNVKATLENNK